MEIEHSAKCLKGFVFYQFLISIRFVSFIEQGHFLNVELQRKFDALFASSFLPTHKKQDTQGNVSEQEKDQP
jgi:hypothetical protein